MTTPLPSAVERRIGVFTTDVDLVIRSWDSALERMTGLAAVQALGIRLDALVPDLASRIPLDLLREPLNSGAAQILAPAIHKYLIPCAPVEPSSEFDRMQQRVIVGVLAHEERAVGLMITVEDVTTRLEREHQLARQLRDGSPALRTAAIRALADLTPVEELGPVASALGDDDWQVRRAAVQTMAKRRDGALVDAVVSALRDGHRDFSVLSSALQLLSMTGLDVTDALAALLKHSDADLRIQAALALGTQPRPGAAAALLTALDDEDINVRFHAIEALGKHRHGEAAERLVDIAIGDDFFLAFPAIDALVRINDPATAPRLTPLLRDPMLSAVAADALGWIGDDESILPLLDALTEGAAPTESVVAAVTRLHRRSVEQFSRADAIEALVAGAISRAGTDRILLELSRASGEALKQTVTMLGWIGDPAIPAALARQLGSPDARAELIEALVRFGRGAVPLLIDELTADERDARRGAVVALGRLGDARAAVPLAALLTDDDDRDLWVVVAGALARLGDRGPFEALLSRVGDPNAAVRQAMIGALNSIGHPNMSERIAALIAAPDALVRDSAVRVAGYFGYSNCADAVFACCGDREESVRVAALENLPYFDDARTRDVLSAALASGTPPVRAAAARALGAMNDTQSQELLSGALNDPEAWVRYFAAIGLGRNAHPSSLPAVELRLRTESAPHVSVALVQAAASIGVSAAPLLASLAREENERGEAALRAIGGLGTDTAMNVLTSALRSPSAARRQAAIESLARDGSDQAVGALAGAAAADANSAVAHSAIAGLRSVANRHVAASSAAIRALIACLRLPKRAGDVHAELAHLNDSAIAALTSLMDTVDVVERRRVTEALGRLSHPIASACLRRALLDDDALVRQLAVETLGRVGAAGLGARHLALAQSDPSPAVRRAAAAALRRSGDASAQRTE